MDANVLIVVSGLRGSPHVMRPVAEGVAAGALQAFEGRTCVARRWALEEAGTWLCDRTPGRGRLATLSEHFSALVRVGRELEPTWQHDGFGGEACTAAGAALDPKRWDPTCLKRRSAASKAWAAAVTQALTVKKDGLWVVEAVIALPAPFARVLERELLG